MRILNRDRDVFADLLTQGVAERDAYGNTYQAYLIGSNVVVDTDLIVSTYNVIKSDRRGNTISTYAVVESALNTTHPVDDVVFVAGKWAYASRWESEISRYWE